MDNLISTVQSVADTARWVAYFRAQETKRADALFRDPYAERLTGDLGSQIANSLNQGVKHEWAWVARTYLFDLFLSRAIAAGADLVINLAAGLDARPYRLKLPSSLHWIEVDFPEIISYKENILAGEKPRCELRRVSLDLLNEEARGLFLSDLDLKFKNIVVASEGLLIYFTPDQVASLARDLAAPAHVTNWIIDLASPGQLKLMQRTMGKQLSSAGAPFQFAPTEGAAFFAPHGWASVEVCGLLKTAAELNRAPNELRSLLPEPTGAFGNYPWSGVCLLKKN